jgi:hypothetical protein
MDHFEHAYILADTSPANGRLRPEWLRLPDATRIFGLSRSKLYELISERRIKSFCLRERGKIKGVRLLSYDSLSAFLGAEAATQDEKAATEEAIV